MIISYNQACYQAKRRFTMKIIKLLPGIVLPIIVALLVEMGMGIV